MEKEASQQTLELARTVLSTEARAILNLCPRLGPAFLKACDLILHSRGRVVVSGIGKSGHVGRKVAATLASTGTPAFFLHPSEACHGDLGMLTPEDVWLALSASGQTQEILEIVPRIKRQGIPVIALTKPDSPLFEAAEAALDVAVEEEACPLGLAPTASTTAALAMGDALAIALLQARGFTAEDFLRAHPGGYLGKRKLLLKVKNLMRTGDELPLLLPEETISQVLPKITAKQLGVGIVVDPTQPKRLLGIFTDGDLRRALEQGRCIQSTSLKAVMTVSPRVLQEEALAVEATRLMEEFKITAIPVLNQRQELVGACNLHDLFSAQVL